MKNIYHRLLLLIAGSTQNELASQIRYLKVENEILRSKLPRRVSVTAQERNRLAKFAAKLGKALNELTSIVCPDTLRRWIRESKKTGGIKQVKKGRPRTKQEIRELIIKLACENDWGYTRIMGELKKLGIKPPSRNTVKNILTRISHLTSHTLARDLRQTLENQGCGRSTCQGDRGTQWVTRKTIICGSVLTTG